MRCIAIIAILLLFVSVVVCAASEPAEETVKRANTASREVMENLLKQNSILSAKITWHRIIGTVFAYVLMFVLLVALCVLCLWVSVVNPNAMSYLDVMLCVGTALVGVLFTCLMIYVGVLGKKLLWFAVYFYICVCIWYIVYWSMRYADKCRIFALSVFPSATGVPYVTGAKNFLSTQKTTDRPAAYTIISIAASIMAYYVAIVCWWNWLGLVIGVVCGVAYCRRYQPATVARATNPHGHEKLSLDSLRDLGEQFNIPTIKGIVNMCAEGNSTYESYIKK